MSPSQASNPIPIRHAARKETARMPHRLYRALDVLSSVAIVVLAAGTMGATAVLGV